MPTNAKLLLTWFVASSHIAATHAFILSNARLQFVGEGIETPGSSITTSGDLHAARLKNTYVLGYDDLPFGTAVRISASDGSEGWNGAGQLFLFSEPDDDDRRARRSLSEKRALKKKKTSSNKRRVQSSNGGQPTEPWIVVGLPTVENSTAGSISVVQHLVSPGVDATLRRTYTLAETTLTVTFALTAHGPLHNARVWWGIADDLLGDGEDSDEPLHTVGDFNASGDFNALPYESNFPGSGLGAAIRLTVGPDGGDEPEDDDRRARRSLSDGGEGGGAPAHDGLGIFLASGSVGAKAVSQECCSFSNVYSNSPDLSPTTFDFDGSYGMYLPLGDVDTGATAVASVTYSAGEQAELLSIGRAVAAAYTPSPPPSAPTPSPPPPSSPPPPYKEVRYAAAVIATGDVADYTPAVRSAIVAKAKDVYEARFGVGCCGPIDVAVEPASVRLTLTLTAPNDGAADEGITLMKGQFATAESASTFLSTSARSVSVVEIAQPPNRVIQGGSSGLSDGAIAGIVVGSVAGFFLVVGAVYCLVGKASSKGARSTTATGYPKTKAKTATTTVEPKPTTPRTPLRPAYAGHGGDTVV